MSIKLDSVEWTMKWLNGGPTTLTKHALRVKCWLCVLYDIILFLFIVLLM